MTTIHLDGNDAEIQQQAVPSRVYSLPLNTTSAINIELFQSCEQLAPVQNALMMTPSASTYIGGAERSRVAQASEVYSVVINTDDSTIKPSVGVADTRVDVHQTEQTDEGDQARASWKTSVGVGTEFDVPEVSPRPSQKTAAVQHNSSDNLPRRSFLSTGSEADSAKSSVPDDVESVNSVGSHGTSASLNDSVALLNLDASNDARSTVHEKQQLFVYGRSHSLSDSIDSQLSNTELTASPGPVTTTKESNRTKVSKIPLSWEDDVGSDKSFDIKLMDASAFILDDFTEEETKTVNDAEELKGTRVALYTGENITVMLKAKCSPEEIGYDVSVLTLLRNIVVRCDQLGKRMKGSAVRLTPYYLNKMKLDDGRPLRECAAEVARQLGGDLILCEAVCQKHADRIHIATEIKDRVYENGTFLVGKLGILVTLWKKHKYSVAAEFSGPLCDHIWFYRPHLLGSKSGSSVKRKRKATDTVRHVFQSQHLLSQMFKTDPTITVAEAARRSFVEIIFYVLYE